MAEVHDLDRHALRPQSDGHRGNHEGGLHLIREQRFFNLRKALKQMRNE